MLLSPRAKIELKYAFFPSPYLDFVTSLLSTFMGIHSSLEIYAEIFNNKYLPFFQSKIMITIGHINIIMLGLMAAIALYRETDESNRYIFYNIIKLGIIGSIMALAIYFVPSLLF